MKRILAIFGSVVYLVLILGIEINLHYCQGELESVSVIVNSSSCCCTTDTNKSNCCDNEKHFFQFSSDNQLTASNIVLSHPYQYFKVANVIELKSNEEAIQNFNVPYDDSGPPESTKAIWKMNCSFLFYG